jgi:glycosyltransferase involved in cell wall biosynthesis
MRVLFFIDSLGAGGAERSTLDYCLFLKSIDVAVEIICLRKKDTGVQQEALTSRIPIHFLNGTSIFKNIREIDKIFNSFKPHIVHSTLFKSRLRAKLHKIFYLRKHVLVESLVTIPYTKEKITERGQGPFRVLLHRMFESLLAVIAVNKMFAISEEVKSHTIRQLFFLNKEKVTVIYRGRKKNVYVEQKTELRQRYAREFGYPIDAVVFIHIGRQDYPKNHLFLMECFRLLQQVSKAGKPLVLLCLGRRGEMSEQIDTIVANHKNMNVLFPGHRHDVEQILAQSDIFVFPSIFEGLGGAIIEAKAAGLPLVVSNIKVFRELLVEGSEAFFADINTLHEFVAKLDLLAIDPFLRGEMGSRNIKSFLAQFSAEEVNRQMYKCYQKLLNESTSTGN